MAGVGVEFPNAFSQFLRSHGVFVVHPPKSLLIQVKTIAGKGLGLLRIELAAQYSLGLLQLVEKLGTDGEQVRSDRKSVV